MLTQGNAAVPRQKRGLQRLRVFTVQCVPERGSQALNAHSVASWFGCRGSVAGVIVSVLFARVSMCANVCAYQLYLAYVCTYTSHTHTHMHIHVHTHIYIYIYIHIHAYIDSIYMYTHTRRQILQPCTHIPQFLSCGGVCMPRQAFLSRYRTEQLPLTLACGPSLSTACS